MALNSNNLIALRPKMFTPESGKGFLIKQEHAIKTDNHLERKFDDLKGWVKNR